MSFLSGKLGCAKFSHPIKTMPYIDIFMLYTSKVLLPAFFRVSTLRWASHKGGNFMQLLPLIGGFLLLIPFSTYAETIDLVCTDATGFSINFEIDTSRSVVLSGGTPARNVFIDRGSISFVIDMRREWYYVINRASGNMTVQAPDKTILPSYKCERAKPKF